MSAFQALHTLSYQSYSFVYYTLLFWTQKIKQGSEESDIMLSLAASDSAQLNNKRTNFMDIMNAIEMLKEFLSLLSYSIKNEAILQLIH